MKIDFGAKSWLYPMPVFMVATYDLNGVADVMNAAWGGVYEENQIMLCLAHSHKTTKNIERNKAFTVSFATADYVVPCDYLGLVSGNQVTDKVEKSGFHTTKSRFVNAPVIDELPMCVECELIKFNEDGMVIGKIVNVSVDTQVLTQNDKIDVQKLNPIVFDGANYEYLALGEKVGTAFHDGKSMM